VDDITVSGIVTIPETGDPVPAVNVLWRKTIRYCTDVDGTYEIKCSDNSMNLVF